MNKAEFKAGNLLRAYSELVYLISSLADIYILPNGTVADLKKIPTEPDNAFRRRLFSQLSLFESIEPESIEESYLGCGIKVFTPGKVIELINNKQRIYDKILKQVRTVLDKLYFSGSTQYIVADKEIIAKYYILAESSVLCFELFRSKDGNYKVENVYMVEVPLNEDIELDADYFNQKGALTVASKKFRDIIGLAF